MKFHAPKGRNTYCGPGAMSIVTGETTDDCTTICRQLTGRRQIQSMTPHEITATLIAMGHDARWQHTEYNENWQRPTLARWLGKRNPEQRRVMTIVFITGHFIVVGGQLTCDNKDPKPRHVKQSPYRRCRVKGWIEVTPGGET